MRRQIQSEIHLGDKIFNKGRRFGSATHYIAAMAVKGTKRIPLLFTIEQIRVAAKRGLRNQEDVKDLILEDDLEALLTDEA